eukprot:2111351-Prymnesium_polylepis.2
MMRDDESGRAHDFGESKLRGAVPPPAAVQVPGRGGGTAPPVARSHRIELGKLFVTEPPWRRTSVPRRPPPQRPS